MTFCKNLFTRTLKKSKKGAGLVEYGLLVGLISVGSIAAIYGTGSEVKTTFCLSQDALTDSLNSVGHFEEETVSCNTTEQENPTGPTAPTNITVDDLS